MIATTLAELGGKESLVVYWKVEDSGKNAEDEAAHADNKVPRRILLRTPALGAGVSAGMGLWIEIVATFSLLFAIMGTAVYELPIQIGGFGVGLTIFADLLPDER